MISTYAATSETSASGCIVNTCRSGTTRIANRSSRRDLCTPVLAHDQMPALALWTQHFFVLPNRKGKMLPATCRTARFAGLRIRRYDQASFSAIMAVLPTLVPLNGSRATAAGRNPNPHPLSVSRKRPRSPCLFCVAAVVASKREALHDISSVRRCPVKEHLLCHVLAIVTGRGLY